MKKVENESGSQANKPTLGFFAQVKIVNFGEQNVARKNGRTTFWRRNSIVVDGDRTLQFMEFSDQQFNGEVSLGDVVRIELAGLDSKAKEVSGRIITTVQNG